MAYTTIDDPTIYFNIKLSTGTGSSQAITGLGFQPDWIWGKRRDSTGHNSLFDSVRGVTKGLESNQNNAEFTSTDYYSSFDSDGFTIASGAGGAGNGSSQTAVQWCWKAGGTAPAITYVVKVVSDSGNKYRFDDFGTSAVTLDLQEGGTYTFDQSDSSNSGHPLRFYTASDKSGGEYTTGVTTTGTAGSSGAKTVITVAASAPTLYYQCSNHAGMGGQANTNSLFGSSNFSGSIQSTVSANTTSGFSIVSYTGVGGTNKTVGHALGSTPQFVIIKPRSATGHWSVTNPRFVSVSDPNLLYLQLTSHEADDTNVNGDNAPSSTIFGVDDYSAVNTNGQTQIAYCMSEKKGFSKFGTYTGGSDPFVYLGFKPAWVMFKNASSAENWRIVDNKRDIDNPVVQHIFANSSSAEASGSSYSDFIDFLSNGFKIRSGSGEIDGSGHSIVYMAFAESPFVNSKGIPTNAR